MELPAMSTNVNLIGIGLYSAAEAGRLLRVSPQRLRRWMGGHRYSAEGALRWMEPLWLPQIPRFGGATFQLPINPRSKLKQLQVERR